MRSLLAWSSKPGNWVPSDQVRRTTPFDSEIDLTRTSITTAITRKAISIEICLTVFRVINKVWIVHWRILSSEVWIGVLAILILVDFIHDFSSVWSETGITSCE